MEYPNEPIDEIRVVLWNRSFAGVGVDDVETAVLDFITDPTKRGFFPHPGEILALVPSRRTGSTVVESTIARYCRLLDSRDAGEAVDGEIDQLAYEVGSVMVGRIDEFRASRADG